MDSQGFHKIFIWNGHFLGDFFRFFTMIFFRKSLDAFWDGGAGEPVFHIIWLGFHKGGYPVYIFFSKYRFEIKNGVEKIKF